jgi:hypothetical protein
VQDAAHEDVGRSDVGGQAPHRGRVGRVEDPVRDARLTGGLGAGQPYRAGRHVHADDHRKSARQQPGEPAVAAADVHDRQRRVEMPAGLLQAPVQLGALGDVPEHVATGTGPMHPGPELFPTARSPASQSDGRPDQPG